VVPAILKSDGALYVATGQGKQGAIKVEGESFLLVLRLGVIQPRIEIGDLLRCDRAVEENVRVEDIERLTSTAVVSAVRHVACAGKSLTGHELARNRRGGELGRGSGGGDHRVQDVG
jgi:hypothetical protein